MLDKVKAHIQRHNHAYLVVGVAGITYLIMKGRYAGIHKVPDTAATTVFVRPLAFFSKQTIITVIQRKGRGRPGYLTYCLETGKSFSSQRMAASSQNVNDAIMSLHVRGKIPSINGMHFRRVQIPS